MSYNYDSKMLYDTTIKKLSEIGVELKDIAEIVYSIQKDYIKNITIEECLENVEAVLRKREVIHAVLTGLAIDEMAQKNLLPEPIQSIIANDEKLYGIDEVLPLGIVNLYGTIGLTNFGYLDKEKVGIIYELDRRKKESNSLNNVQTFADDIIAAIAAAAGARIAHKYV